jgi:hypothetical protein
MFRIFNRLPSVQTKGKRLFLKKTVHREKYLVVFKTDQFSTEVGDYVVAANEKVLCCRWGIQGTFSGTSAHLKN